MKRFFVFFLIISVALGLLQSVNARRETVQLGEVRPLTGSLDKVPVFNSNFPEIVWSSGILLSTFPKAGKVYPDAHLNYKFNGRFDVFTHHISRHSASTLFQGIMLGNASGKEVTIKAINGLTYSSLPDSPFYDQNMYSGPGDRLTSELLKGELGKDFPKEVKLKPYEAKLLMVLPVPTKNYKPSHNGRSLLGRFKSNGPVYVANLAMFLDDEEVGEKKHLNPDVWLSLLNKQGLVVPREKPSTLASVPESDFHYGRVGGVAIGSVWNAKLTDKNSNKLKVPEQGQTISYPLSTVIYGEMGTKQNQSAKIRAHYKDTAYEAHGNYGIHYKLELPLYNPTSEEKEISLIFQTPIKERELSSDGLRFFINPLYEAVWFRGTVKFAYEDDKKQEVNHFYHLVQKRGEMSKPLESFTLQPKEIKKVRFELIYPPDATPPQVLTVRTESE